MFSPCLFPLRCVVTLWGMIAICAGAAVAADDRPNILVVLVDDLGYSDFGCYGGEINTPNIDALAQKGVRFRQFYNCARCCPTRASLLTGTYPHRVGLGNNGKTMSMQAPTLADRLKATGYETSMVGKWHLSELPRTNNEPARIRWMNHQGEMGIPFADPATYPTQRGFDRYFGVIWGVVDFFDPFSLTDGDQPVKTVPKDFYITDALTDRAIRDIKDFSKTDQPFFMYLAHTAPHWPIHAKPADIAKYKGKYAKGWDALREQRFQRQQQLGLFSKDMPIGDVISRGVEWDALPADEQAFQAAKMEVHAAMVDCVDQNLGRVIQTLEETGQYENTAIFLMSDNGASPEIPGKPGYDRNGQTRDGKVAHRDLALRQPQHRSKLGSAESYTGIGPAWANAVNTPLRFWKKESYEGGCRTPFIVHWPAGLKAEQGSISDAVGHVMDIAPTCLDLAGVEAKTSLPDRNFPMDGKPLTPLLQGDSRDGHETLYFEHVGGKGARHGKWKLSALKNNAWELFDIEADPGETRNLAAQHPHVFNKLKADWLAWYQRVNAKPPQPKSSADAKKQRPNIVLVFIDDMGWGDFSCFGNKSVNTQNIDRLAREGLRFEQFYVNSPICSPSRCAISTGQYPQRWRITSYLNNRKSNAERGVANWLDPEAPMLARFLQNAGYATGHFGKWHLGGQRDVGEAPLITEYGFDASLTNFEGLGPRVLAICDAHDGKPTRRHTLGSDTLGRGTIQWVDRSLVTQEFTSAALQFVKAAEKKQQPFYINVWPDDVHSPFFPPAARRGDGSKQKLYHGVLDTMDEQLGVLFDYIRNSESLRDNTMILVCSDNGPEPGAGSAGHFRGNKTMLYEGGIRSPLIVWAPGMIDSQRAGSVNDTSLFSAIDLVPSLLEVADVNVPETVAFDGEDLSSVLLGRKEDSRQQMLFFRRPPDRDNFYGDSDLPDLAVRWQHWKLLCEYDGSDPQLYNLQTDPAETKNLASENPAITKELVQALTAWHQSMPPDNGPTYKIKPRRKPMPAKKQP